MTNAELLRKLRAEAVARGYCGVCRCRPAKTGRRTCQDCLDRGRETKQRLKQARRCINCCKPSDAAQRCSSCTRKYSKRFGDMKRRLGQCWHCGYPAAPGYAHCLPCKEAMRLKALSNKTPTLIYRCRVCGQTGHNARSCASRAVAP